MKRAVRGLGLPELLVALALGALVCVFACGLLFTAQAAYAAQLSTLEVDEAGLYAMASLSQAVRQAGYGLAWDDAGAEPPVQGQDAVPPAPGRSDLLLLHYGADPQQPLLNCAGFAVNQAARGWSAFLVAPGPDGEAELRCRYRGAHSWASEPLLRGVDSFQVWYGIDTDAVADGIPNRYVAADTLEALDAALDVDGASDGERAQARRRHTWWRRVCTVELALLLHGARGTHAGPLRRFVLFGNGALAQAVFDEAALAAGQRSRVRRLFRMSVAARNPVPRS